MFFHLTEPIFDGFVLTLLGKDLLKVRFQPPYYSSNLEESAFFEDLSQSYRLIFYSVESFFFSPKCFVQVRERHGVLRAVTEFGRIWRKYLFEFCSDEFGRNPWKYTGYPQL